MEVNAMTETRKIRFATDLVTFYAPGFWGGSGDMGDIEAAIASGRWDPIRFWERILNSSQAAGLDGIELTFRPGDWHSALAAYGSPRGFAAALKDRGLELCSGFFSTRIPGTDRYANFADPADHARLIEMASAYAEFLHGCGAQILVTALPLRTSRDADRPRDARIWRKARTPSRGLQHAAQQPGCGSLHAVDRSDLRLPLSRHRAVQRRRVRSGRDRAAPPGSAPVDALEGRGRPSAGGRADRRDDLRPPGPMVRPR